MVIVSNSLSIYIPLLLKLSPSLNQEILILIPMFAEEMDWDKNGMVNFKEFLFAFTQWVGIDENEDEDDNKDKA